MTRVLRKVGMLEQLGYRPKPKRIEQPTTPEQIAADHARSNDFLRSMASAWGVEPEDVDLWLGDPDAYRAKIDLNENAATRKIKDMEARVAVEGNTDGNHDNVEAAE